MSNTSANSFKKMVLKGDIVSLSDTFKIILMADGFVFDGNAHHSYADVLADEIANTYGYITGGNELSSVSLALDNVHNLVKLGWAYSEWIPVGGSIVTSGAIIFDDTTDIVSGHDYTDAIVYYIDFGETKTALDGTNLRVQDIYTTIA